MAQIETCPSCGDIYVKNQFRDVCQKCWKEEEQAYDQVSQFMRRRENRAATILQVVEAVGIEEELLLKFIRTGRLKVTQFPNLGYPCDKCGTIIRAGKLCEPCALEIKKDLEQHEQDEAFKEELRKQEKQATYFTTNKTKR
ncbi:TIGR03826 family flagellar region protein [Robertmurraya sp. P23]|uniref:TIGR03826 family flagellar region protein n=1 Tax=Robertmurraya sp. P23 TaxID=3436931 RepID=UPI003D9999C9